MINAVFNHRQFWDGRAENVFNGVNHLGQRDSDAKVFRADDRAPRRGASRVRELEPRVAGGRADRQRPRDVGAGPHLQDVGRETREGLRKIGKSSQSSAARQTAGHPTDSVLGPISRWPQRGLDCKSYDQMIRAAFHERWWQSSKVIRVNADGTKTWWRRTAAMRRPSMHAQEYALIQYNFSLFFGLAVQLYEATLVSDDTPWDRFRRENPTATIRT